MIQIKKTEFLNTYNYLWSYERNIFIVFLFIENAIPIKSWFSDSSDTALLNLLPFLDALRFCGDVRSVLSRNLHLHRIYQ